MPPDEPEPDARIAGLARPEGSPLGGRPEGSPLGGRMTIDALLISSRNSTERPPPRKVALMSRALVMGYLFIVTGTAPFAVMACVPSALRM